jgi:hypothetical protein
MIFLLTNFPPAVIRVVDDELLDVLLTSQPPGKDHADLRNEPDPRQCENRARTRQRSLPWKPRKYAVWAFRIATTPPCGALLRINRQAIGE